MIENEGWAETSSAGPPPVQGADSLLLLQRSLGIALASCTDLGQALLMVLDAAISIEGLDSGGVYLIDRETGALDLAASRGLSEEFVVGVRHFDSGSRNHDVVLGGVPKYVVHREMVERAILPPEPIGTGEGLRALAVIPLLNQGAVIGCLNVASHSVDEIPPSSRHALEALAASVGSAIVRIRTERDLRESEAKYRALIETTRTGFVIVDSSGNVIDSNLEYARLTGRNQQELRGRPVTVWTAAHDRERNAEAVQKCFKDGFARNLEIDYEAPDGRITPVEINATVVHSVEGDRALTLVHDISERRRVAEEMRSTEELLRVIFDGAGDGIMVAHRETRRVHLANRLACSMLGYALDELVGLRVDDIHPQSALDRVVTVFGQLGRREIHLATDVPVCRKDGSVFYADIAADILTLGGEVYLVGSFRDMTQRRRLDAELQKADRLESIGVLAGGIAHDFNNILTGIMGNISLAQKYCSADPKLIVLLNEAERAAFRARGLTQQLLTFTRGGAPQKRTACICELVTESANFVLRGSSVKCRFVLPADLWSVDVDMGQVGQVIQNLVLNAAQAMADGGVVEIRADNVQLAHGEVPSLGSGRYVRVVVSDTGQGIPPENLTRIFDPYFTTKDGGSGLGLAIAYSIVRKHEGHIEAQSELGQGSKFLVYLPAAEGPAVPCQPTQKGEAPRCGRVLLMDDDEAIRRATATMLEVLGYSVQTACDGVEALRILRDAREAGQPPSLIILDLTVPGGMGGIECSQEIRKTDPNVKIVVMSGYSNSPVMDERERLGLQGFLAKPFGIGELEALLESL